MEKILEIFNWKAIIEVLILWFVIYRIFLFLKGTRAVYLLRGIIILIISFFIFQKLGLFVLTWVLTKFFAFFLILIVIIFQPELREGLIRLGKRHLFPLEVKQEDIEKTMKAVVTAAANLSKKKVGALIAIKREVGLQNVIETGLSLNAQISTELLENIFHPFAPLHDGGLVIEGARVISASCLFPLTDNPNIERTLGMRHRAAVGLSEHSDAIVIAVSEESGTISLAINGQFTRSLSPEELFTILKGQLRKEK
jgi:diadenylate cyclase